VLTATSCRVRLGTISSLDCSDSWSPEACNTSSDLPCHTCYKFHTSLCENILYISITFGIIIFFFYSSFVSCQSCHLTSSLLFSSILDGIPKSNDKSMEKHAQERPQSQGAHFQPLQRTRNWRCGDQSTLGGILHQAYNQSKKKWRSTC
jgi:hypothetical protein